MATTKGAALRFLTQQQCQIWATAHGYRLYDPPWGRQVDVASLDEQRFHLPEDSGARMALARMLWDSLASDAPEALVWVTEWGVWPSGEHLPLAAAVRRGYGETRSLHDAPGAIIGRNEADAGLSLVALATLFLWDCWLLLPGGPVACFLSHDEYGAIVAPGQVPPEILARLRAYTTLLPAAT